MSELINLFEIDFSFDKKVILDQISFSARRGQVIGVVGKNGAGKTTLLNIIAGVFEQDSGRITKPNDTRIGFLPQHFHLDNSKTVLENILSVDFFDKKDITYDIEDGVNDLMKELNCPEKNLLVKSLSGGQKRRVALVMALVNKPDILILDEPTNHLDLESIEHLERLVKEFAGSVILVSHDRYFLDNVTTNILEVYQKKVYMHNGGYSDYLQSKNIRLDILEKTDERRKQFLVREKEWVNAGVKARETKNKGRLRAYHELDDIDDFYREKEVKDIVPPATKLGNKIINFEGVEVKTPNGKSVISNFTLAFEKGMKIGLLGKNGVGKTTLLKTFVGEYSDFTGKVDRGLKTKFNYLDQEKDNLDENRTVYQEVANEREKVSFGDRLINARGYLRRFLFVGDDVHKHVSLLSGGEKTRVLLAKILKNGGNFLVLDEPTNDLDLSTLSVLERSIQHFDGCSIVVSHDRYFLNKVCNYILFLQGGGKYILSTGNYDNFVKKFGGIEKAVTFDIKKQVKQKPKETIKVSKIEQQNRRSLQRLERQIETISQRIKEIEAKFFDSAFYINNSEEAAKIHMEMESLKEEKERKEDSWLRMST